MHLFFGSWRTGFVQWLLGADLGRSSSASAGLLLTPETPVHNIIYCYVEIYYIWNTFSLETTWAQTVALQLTQGTVSGELNTRPKNPPLFCLESLLTLSTRSEAWTNLSMSLGFLVELTGTPLCIQISFQRGLEGPGHQNLSVTDPQPQWQKCQPFLHLNS